MSNLVIEFRINSNKIQTINLTTTGLICKQGSFTFKPLFTFSKGVVVLFFNKYNFNIKIAESPCLETEINCCRNPC